MATLDEIRTAMEPGNRDIELARKLAADYITEHPEHFEQLRGLSIDECVQSVSVFRDADMQDEQWIVEAWLLHAHDPRQREIVGGLNMPIDPDQILGMSGLPRRANG